MLNLPRIAASVISSGVARLAPLISILTVCPLGEAGAEANTSVVSVNAYTAFFIPIPPVFPAGSPLDSAPNDNTPSTSRLHSLESPSAEGIATDQSRAPIGRRQLSLSGARKF